MRRQIQALEEGRQDCFGYNGQDSWTVHIEGACGELAFARATKRSWDGSVGRFRGMGADVDEFQVRTRSKHSYELIIRPNADPNDVYALVTGVAPTFIVHGVCSAGRVMRPEYLQTYGNRPAAYFVPHHELRPIELVEVSGDAL